MATERITENPDLATVLGELSDDESTALTEQLSAVDERLAKLAETLSAEGSALQPRASSSNGSGPARR
jgi:hypothetical protein